MSLLSHQFHQSRRNWLSVALAVIVIFVASACIQLYFSYDEHLQSIDRNLEIQSLTLIKQAEAEFRATELALRFARSKLQQRAQPDSWQPEEVYVMFTDIISTFNAAEDSATPHDLFWANSQGTVRVTSYSNPTPEIAAGDRGYFKHHRENTTPDVYYSGSLQSRLTSRWVIYQTVRLNDSMGNFAGVVGITTRVDALEVFFSQLGLDDQSSIIIAHRQGGWSYRFPFDNQFTEVDFIGSPVFDYMVAKRRGRTVLESSPYDGETRRAGFYLGESSQLLAAVTLSQAAAVRQFLPVLQQRGLMLAFAVLILSVAVFSYDRVYKRSGEALRLANIDELTQVPNRRSLEERLQWEWRRLQRNQQPLGLLFIDIDYFKKYNDYYGHEAGDICLTRVAQIIHQTLKRPDDFMARYGGEEFIVLLSGNNYTNTGQMGEIILERIRAEEIPHDASPISPFLTASVGYAAMVPREDDGSTRLKEWADKALYEAKHAGRDCVRGHRAPLTEVNTEHRQT